MIGASPNASCSLDPLPTWVLKNCLSSLLTVITFIVNISLSTGDFCKSLKKALVTPLLKHSDLDQDVFKNYRPISNLPFISKLIERIVAAQLAAHLRLNGLLEKFQSAYRSLHSTETALLRVHNDILQAVDESGAAILVMLDLSAAFDTIDHAILLSALQHQFGLAGTVLKWFVSYLTSRVQAIKIGQAVSEFIELVFGVPQGSVLGPVLFTLYTASLGAIISRHGLLYHLYADDTQLYIAFKLKSGLGALSREEAIAKVEACVKDIRAWMANNFLKLNDDKTEIVVFSTGRIAIPELSISIGDDLIPISALPPKNLGVYFDPQLNLKKHIDVTAKSLNSSLFKIGKVRRFLDKSSCATLTNGLFTSRLDYCNSLLYGVPSSSLDRFQKLQNRAARTLSLTRKFDHITPVLKELHWLPVERRVEYKVILMCFKCLHGLAPEYLCELIKWHSPNRRLRSESQHLVAEQSWNLKTFGYRRFAVAAPRLWNQLPLPLRSMEELSHFQAGLKTHLFSKEFH